MRPRRCQAGEVVVRAGEAGGSLFLVESGTLVAKVAGKEVTDPPPRAPLAGFRRRVPLHAAAFAGIP